MPRLFIVLAYAWLILVGGVLLFTPDGVFCIACGRALESVIGLVAIVLGVVGLATHLTGKQLNA